jgi:hypothetical protein
MEPFPFDERRVGSFCKSGDDALDSIALKALEPFGHSRCRAVL